MSAESRTPRGPILPPKVILYRQFWKRSNWRIGRWPMSSGTAFDIGPVRVMTRRAFNGAIRLTDWWSE